MNNDQVILHHYPQSPVSEKVRIVLGMKGIAWKSVEIPRLPPKPNLMPLTGGYRLTPVMQVGADIYCDSICIIRELERRYPKPTLFPGGAQGLAWGIGQWTDEILFQDVVTVALVEMSPNMPPDFLADRGPLYFGPDFSLDQIKARYKECLANVRTQFGWLDQCVQSRKFMLGSEPGLPDVLAYYLVWFLDDRLADGGEFLSQFKNLLSWQQRMLRIGHGQPATMTDLEALDIAKDSTPQPPQQSDPRDPLGLNIGDQITIEPISGGPQVAGSLHSISPNHLALLRHEKRVGQVCVHFPRPGYRVRQI